jgi:hypothetical protein
MVEVDRALTDKRMLGAGLEDLGTWATWLTVLKAAFGLPLDDREYETFAAVAGNRAVPRQRVRELWGVAGRRSGKSRMAAAIAIYLTLFVKHKLSRGERGMCLVIAGSIDQARTVFGYVRGFLEAAPALAKEVVASTQSEVTLRNGIVIAVHSNSFRTVRGRTLVACVMDEVSFWRDESSATPDIETYRAVLPSLATTNGMLVGISTPYRKFGLLHTKHRDHFGVDDPEVLVVQGASKTFNPSLSDAVIAAQRAADPTAAGAEWDAVFRTDIGAFLDDALIDRAVEYDRPLELPPADGIVYRAFTDASGGVGHDAYVLAIGHKDSERCVIDVCRGTRGAFDPMEVTREYAALCKSYRISKVTGDAYGAEWVAGAWRGTGIEYVKSSLPKSAIYLECVPLFTRGLVGLPDHAKLVRELRLLERHTHRSGKDSVEHPRNGRDDHANAVCGVLRELSTVAWDAVPIVAPVVVFGQQRAVPGGVLGQGVVAAAPSAAPDTNPMLKQNQPVEPWRSFVRERQLRRGLRGSIHPKRLVKEQTVGEQQKASVEAERIVASLEQKRAKCIQRGTDIADERAVLGYGTHVDNDKASRAKLDKLNAEAAVHASELASLDAAIREAGERLAAARHVEAIEADKANAREVAKVVDELAEHGQVVDDVLHDLIEAGANLRAALNRLHGLGCNNPSHEQLATLGHLSILTALNKTIWKRGFETLAPNQRKSFTDVVAAWRTMLMRDVERRLGEEPVPAATIPDDDLSIPVSLRRDLPPVEVQQ